MKSRLWQEQSYSPYRSLADAIRGWQMFETHRHGMHFIMLDSPQRRTYPRRGGAPIGESLGTHPDMRNCGVEIHAAVAITVEPELFTARSNVPYRT